MNVELNAFVVIDDWQAVVNRTVANYFDSLGFEHLDQVLEMRVFDLLMITADHGCDPSYTKTTDHTREYVPYLVCGKGVKPGVDLGTRLCFGTIAQTVCEYLGVDASSLDGHSVLQEILK